MNNTKDKSRSPNADRRRIWRAQLADMPPAVIIAWLREQGYAVMLSEHEQVVKAAVRGMGSADAVRERAARFAAALDRLPAGYPPRAEDDLPFDASDQRP